MYAEKFSLVWLDPAPMNNTQALAMTKAGAAKFGIRTISDMAAKADQLVMAGPPEFQEREDGLPGLQKAYGNFQIKEYRSVDSGAALPGAEREPGRRGGGLWHRWRDRRL